MRKLARALGLALHERDRLAALIRWELKALARGRRFRRALLLLGAAAFAAGFLCSRLPAPSGSAGAPPPERRLAALALASGQLSALVIAARALRGMEARAARRALRATPCGGVLIGWAALGSALLASMLAAGAALGLAALGSRLERLF